MERLQTYLRNHFDEWLTQTVETVRNDTAETGSNRPELLRDQVRQGARAVADSILSDDASPFQNYIRSFAVQQAERGISIEATMALANIGAQPTLAAITSLYADDVSHAIQVARRYYYDVIISGHIAIAEAYLTVQQRQISNQAEALRELSTPIVPVYEGVLVLPLVGIIDSRRAGQFIEGMLENITSKLADVVIIDITGVRVIDTGVANYLLQAARAARLLGSQVVLVGIGAEIAQTMVQLGIDLASITTRADLQSGIAYALEVKGKHIVHVA